MLDPRVRDAVESIEDQVDRLRDELAPGGGKVDSAAFQGRPCIRTRLRKQGATVWTYSFYLGDGTELRAVYVFRDGHDDTIAAVRHAVESSRHQG